MKTKILAHWFLYDNFGDLLTPYLIRKLSGCDVAYRWAFNETSNISIEWHEFLRCLKQRRRYDYNRLFKSETKKPVILGVGSILDNASPNSMIWGAGFMNPNEVFHGGEVFAVRGKYSAEKLLADGFPSTTVWGDPALLLPLVYERTKKASYSVGIVSHISDEKNIRQKFPKANVISVKCNYNVETVLDKILDCEYIISTSLHGLIVSHAYGIPAIWVHEGYIGTDGFKFKDYFSSVDIPEYNGDVIRISDMVNKKYSELPSQVQNLMLPRKDVKSVQEQLLKCAPFPILNIFLEKYA